MAENKKNKRKEANVCEGSDTVEKLKYMIEWRNKKIAILEKEVLALEDALGVCCSALAALLESTEGRVSRIEKSAVLSARLGDFEIDCDERYYYFTHKDEVNVREEQKKQN